MRVYCIFFILDLSQFKIKIIFAYLKIDIRKSVSSVYLIINYWLKKTEEGLLCVWGIIKPHLKIPWKTKHDKYAWHILAL